MCPKVRVLITDLDNTLFDWLGVWHASFSAMLNRIQADSGIDRRVLEREFRSIHQRYGTVEYAFSIEELPSLQRLHPNADLTSLYADAIREFREARRKHLNLYPGVKETLVRLHEKGCALIGYTESFAYYSAYRIRRLDLDLLLDALYSPADHDLPAGRTPEQLRHYPADHYSLRRTAHHHTPRGERKPNPEILFSIIQTLEANASETVFVGDSLMKDVLMAQQAGVIDIWAKYGYAPARPEYDLLRAVSHWIDADVERERQLSDTEVNPTHVLEHGFSELLDLFDFEALHRVRAGAG